MKTWKRRYTILSGNVLYYFKSPKDKAPAGFLPLENIEVRAHKEKNQFELVPAEGAPAAVFKSASAASLRCRPQLPGPAPAPQTPPAPPPLRAPRSDAQERQDGDRQEEPGRLRARPPQVVHV